MDEDASALAAPVTDAVAVADDGALATPAITSSSSIDEKENHHHGTANAVEETPEQHEERIRLTHELLAIQLEYYFSVTNLSRDTYVSTLRKLNDGYVPVSILANFGKVQALAPYESAWEAVCAAAMDYSAVLELVELNDQGKKLSVLTPDSIRKKSNNENNEENKSAIIILAVGTISGEAIPQSQIQQVPQRRRSSNDDNVNNMSPPTTTTITNSSATIDPSSKTQGSVTATTQNTIILREVSEDVDENIVRNLFDFDGSPSIQTVHLDLHNCWFVTLDSSSREEMVNVMMKLRTQKFPSGETVKARLKSSAAASTSSPLSANAVIYTHPSVVSTMYAPQFNSNNSGNSGGSSSSSSNGRKKRSSNSKKRNNNRDNSSNSNSHDGGGSGKNESNRCRSSSVENNQQDAGNVGYLPKRRYEKDESLKPTRSSSSYPSSSSGSYKNISNSGGSGSSSTRNKKLVIGVVEKKVQAPPPPSMGETNFPSLPPTSDGNSKPFQVEKVPTEDEMIRNGEKERCYSDTSSTATTTSSSLTLTEDTPRSSNGGTGGGSTSSSTADVIVPGGYAAALLRPAAKVLVNNTTAKVGTTMTERKHDASAASHQMKKQQKKKEQLRQQRSSTASNNHDSKDTNNSIERNTTDENKNGTATFSNDEDDAPVVVTIQPPSWGRGRSFAAVLAEKAV